MSGHDIISDGVLATSSVRRTAFNPLQMTDTSTRGVRMSDATTRGIRIQVRSEFIPDRSSPREGSYLFQYHVRISNTGSDVAQLISREWIITNADGEVERVKGQGVVGEQPVLPPGGSFEYTSFCPLKTSVGAMQGSYQMVTTDGERFDAVIAPFTLAVPNALN
jgi:ApaG protein